MATARAMSPTGHAIVGAETREGRSAAKEDDVIAAPDTPVGATMSQQQKDVAARAGKRLMAPCCYTQTIDVHVSDIAAQMRTEVAGMALGNFSETAIYAHYKNLYGERILAVPDGMLGDLAYAIPITATTLATGLLSLLLYKFHNRRLAIGRIEAASHAAVASAGKQAHREEIRKATAW